MKERKGKREGGRQGGGEGRTKGERRYIQVKYSELI